MTLKELQFYQSHRNDYKIGDNQYKCPICNKIFSVKAFSQHIRKEHFNKDNNIKNSGGYNYHYSLPDYKQKLSLSRINSANAKRGNLKVFTVKCDKCGKVFDIEEYEYKFQPNRKYYCSISCANSRIFDVERRQQISTKISCTIKQQLAYLLKYDSNEYQRRLAMLPHQRKHSKYFTSKNERLIRDYIIANFKQDEWTFGGCILVNGLRLVRDLYSNKLKICFEYDGIWHFKDIHSQLKSKQEKDNALEQWCINNGYRLIRISESWFIDNGENIDMVVNLIYNTTEQIIKMGQEYH